MTDHDGNAWARRAKEWIDLQKLLVVDEEAVRKLNDGPPGPAASAESPKE